MVHVRGDGRQLGIRRVQAQPLDGRVGVEVELHIEHLGDKTLHVQRGAHALLDQSLHSLAGILDRPATHLDYPPHQFDHHPALDGELLGIKHRFHPGDLAHLDPP